MRTFPLTALFIFIFSLTSFAEEDSWLPSFIGDAFKNDLEKAGTYRAHFEDNAYIDLKFDEDTAFITVVAFKQDKDKHKPWSEEQIQRKVEEKGFPYTVANIEFSFNPIPLRFIEDGFKVGYEIIDNKIYFDSPLAGIEAGNMGRVDNDFLTITFRKTKSLEELVFYKLVEKLEVGEWLYQYSFWTKPEEAIEACSTNWKEELPQMWRLEERKTLAIDKERLLLYESNWDEELLVIWEPFESDLQVNPELYLIQIIDGSTMYGCLTPAPVGYKSYLISQGYEIVEEQEYNQILAEEEAKEARLEEQRLAEEERKLAEEERK